jgi:hypothetical protein
MQLPHSQDSEASYSVPAARSRSSDSSSFAHHTVPAPAAARGNTKPATKASVKEECVNPAPRAAADTAASPGFISQMRPKNIMETFNKMVQGIAVKREKRNRDEGGEQTEDEPPRKKFREMKVPELKEVLKARGIRIPSGTLKEGLVQLAETKLTPA